MTRNNDSNGAPKGLVFNIQKFSLHDGPGIRTIVFLKGCPLACIWCSNPEGQSTAPELIYTSERCIGTEECDRCGVVCLERALTEDDEGKMCIDRSICDGCCDCAVVCPSRALEESGEWVGVDDVVRVVEEDDAFYARSGGGLTVSGGEPLAQGAFVQALLGAARSRGIDTAIETSGLCNWKTMRDVAPLTDRIFFDIKCLDPEKHERVTGVSNRKILQNFQRLRAEFPQVDVVVRTPVIPGVNDSEDDIRAIAEFVNDAGGASAYELLPYHAFGEAKYTKLGKHYPASHLEPPSEQRMKGLREIATLCDASCMGRAAS
ncbi:MAG: glycyl-radical enzyme activating protein [Deltaproteobacteria bacterium]|nr:glycyl-radical enzyme activating protein [Deltaproteobacteria bacterium]